MPAHFHVFYCRQRTDEVIDSFHPEPMPLSRIVDLAVKVLVENGDYFGLIDADQGLLQLLYLKQSAEDGHPIRLEIPDNKRHGCYTRRLSSHELAQVLSRLPSRLTKDTVTGLHFEPGWGR